jgi:hypothetical protein
MSDFHFDAQTAWLPDNLRLRRQHRVSLSKRLFCQNGGAIVREPIECGCEKTSMRDDLSIPVPELDKTSLTTCPCNEINENLRFHFSVPAAYEIRLRSLPVAEPVHVQNWRLTDAQFEKKLLVSFSIDGRTRLEALRKMPGKSLFLQTRL